jgi:uncharacterized protein
MILSDANLIIYSYNELAIEHKTARSWFEERLSSDDLFYFSWQTITAFLRISTNPKIFRSPMTETEAIETVNGWLDNSNVEILKPTSRHWSIFSRIIGENKVRGALMMDAHLAALAIEHGTTLATTDRDFARFDGLKIVNPLKA